MMQKVMSAAIAGILSAVMSQAHAIEELTRMPILKYSDLSEVDGVILKAQVPEPSMTLYDKTVESSVWQTPMASRTTGEGVHQIWYLRFDYDSQADSALCLGEIRNNQWTLPQLSSTPPPWGGINNIVMTGSGFGTFNPHQIVTDPTGGLLMFYWDKPDTTSPAGVMRATSSSPGTLWMKVSGTVFNEPNDAFTASRIGSQYRLYQTALQPWPHKPYPDNLPDRKRVITLRTSNDSASWTSQNLNMPTLAPDANDVIGTEFYAFKSFPYGNGYAGILWKYYPEPLNPNVHSSIYKYELVVSDDGITWARPYLDTNLGFFSYADPIAYAHKLSFPAQFEGDLVLMSWVKDRMVAATGNGGTFRTRPFYFPSAGIDINADTYNGGWIDVTACDKDGTPIVGWNTHRIQNDNGTNLPLPWSAGHEPVSLRITIGGGAKVYGISARGQ